MASEMIERVAEAAFAAVWQKDRWDLFGENDHVKLRYRAIARAAIQAMREPLVAFLEEAESDNDFINNWPRVINAELEEK